MWLSLDIFVCHVSWVKSFTLMLQLVSSPCSCCVSACALFPARRCMRAHEQELAVTPVASPWHLSSSAVTLAQVLSSLSAVASYYEAGLMQVVAPLTQLQNMPGKSLMLIGGCCWILDFVLGLNSGTDFLTLLCGLSLLLQSMPASSSSLQCLL